MILINTENGEISSLNVFARQAVDLKRGFSAANLIVVNH